MQMELNDFFQFFHVLNARSFTKSLFLISAKDNPFLIISLTGALFVQLFALYSPKVQSILGTTILPVNVLFETLLVSTSIILVISSFLFIY